MTHSQVRDDYFEWMYNTVCKNRYDREVSYRNLLTYLHQIRFTYAIRSDEDREHDGTQLRHRYALLFEDNYYFIRDSLDIQPCTVLEMIVALAIRCEETIMDDPQLGDRTGQWFWEMIVSLGLGSMTDRVFDECYVEDKVECFLQRRYKPNGEGGLFTIRGFDQDMSSLPIWSQLCCFLRTKI